MRKYNQDNKVKLVIAVIGLLGVILTATLSNWDKIIPSSKTNKPVESHSNSITGKDNNVFNGNSGNININYNEEKKSIVNNINNSMIQFSNDLDENYERYLTAIKIGVSPDYVISLFGQPIKEKEINNKYIEVMYVFNKFNLQVIYKKDKAEFYSITSKSSDFKFGFLTGNKSFKEILGDNITFEDKKINSHEEKRIVLYANSSASGRLGSVYAEKTILSRPSQYLYLAHSLFGHQYNESFDNLLCCFSQNNKKNISKELEKSIHAFREVTIPNTFGVSSENFSKEFKWDDIWGHIVGIDYELMEDIYEN